MNGICTMPFLISLFVPVLNGDLSEKENMLQSLEIESGFDILLLHARAFWLSPGTCIEILLTLSECLTESRF
jgi:hypothetical protein